MDRFSIALGKSYVSVFSEAPEHVPEIKNKVVVEDVWYTQKQKISLERSPKEARCPVCGKSIDAKMLRFSAVTFNERRYKGRSFSITRKYHVKCLPKEEQVCIKNTKSAKTKKKERKRERMKDEDITTLDCPKCPTGKLVHRKNKLTHERFLGCSNYPTCKYTEPEPLKETDGVADAASVWE